MESGPKGVVWNRARVAKRWLRRQACSVAFRVVRATPVEECPALWANLLEIKVPRAVQRNPTRLPEGSANINIIFELLRRTAGLPGQIAECGVFRGASLVAMGLFVKQHEVRKVVLGFDSFEGFDAAVAFDQQLGGADSDDKRPGGFADTSHALVHEKIAGLGLQNVVVLNKGYFLDKLCGYSNETFSFVHLDCDIYQSYRDCLAFFYPKLPTGGIILFDEYNDPPWPGCNLAVDEFLRDKPEQPIEIERDNYLKWYIQKL